MAKNLFISIFCLVFLITSSSSDDLCNDDFCKTYLTTATCPEIPDACKVQNSTYNGIFLPAPGPCNCCKYCVSNLDAGDECPLGDASTPTPTKICGHGLSCKLTDNLATCQRMDSPCVNSQVAFEQNLESGNVGHLEMKPSCDRNGFYNPFRCIPGEICYCVAEDGERIFGEIPFTPNPYFSLKCKCSRNYYKAKQINNKNLNPSQHFRCQPNGDYDTIQCIDDKCMCVDADNGHLTYPKLEFVNVTSISGKTLPCFNNETHLEAEYLRGCERIHLDMLNKTKEYEKDNTEMFGQIMPNCQLDGYFAPVQETFDMKYCSDMFGKRIENYELPKIDALSSTMNCNCARVRTMISDKEKPDCCENGNYKQIQQRRGLCRCVDKNGNQVGKEVDCNQIQKLSCLPNACAV